MQYTIRQGIAADQDLIYSLFSESVRPYVEPIWGWDEAYQRKDFDESFRIGQFQVVEARGAFAGFFQRFAHEGVLELCEIHLLPEYRGQGIGSSVIRGLQDEGVVLRTGCFKENVRARMLYLQLGFRLIEETSTHFLLEYRKNEDCIGGNDNEN